MNKPKTPPAIWIDPPEVDENLIRALEYMLTPVSEREEEVES